MDFRKFSVNLMGLGVLIVLIAIGWWFFYFKSLAPENVESRVSLSDFVPCLYKVDPICDSAKVFHFADRFLKELADPNALRERPKFPAYDYKVFWAGLIAFAAGLLIRLSVKK